MVEITPSGVRLTNTHFSVLEKIKRMSKKDGYCYMSNATLARECHLSPSHTSHIITDLRDAYYIMGVYHYKGTECIRRDLVLLPDGFRLPDTSIPETAEKRLEFFRKMHQYKAELDERLANVAQVRRIIYNATQQGVGIPLINEILYDKKYRNYTLDYVEEKIDVLAGSLSVQNPGGFLRRAIEHNWTSGSAGYKRAQRKKGKRRITPQQYHYNPKPITIKYRPDTQKNREASFLTNYLDNPEMLEKLMQHTNVTPDDLQAEIEWQKEQEQQMQAAIAKKAEIRKQQQEAMKKLMASMPQTKEDQQTAPEINTGLLQRDIINAGPGAKREELMLKLRPDQRDAMRMLCARMDAELF